MTTVTIGSNDYDVYVSDVEASTYLAADYGRATAWAALTSDQKKMAVVSATRVLDRQRWVGAKTDSDQALAFPRTGLTDADGNAVASDTVPTAVENACAILAADIAADSDLANDPSTASNIKSVKAGSANVEFFRPQSGTKLPTYIMDLIGAFLTAASSGSSVIDTAEDCRQTTRFPETYGLKGSY